MRSDTFIANVGHERLPVSTPHSQSEIKSAVVLVEHFGIAKWLKRHGVFLSFLQMFGSVPQRAYTTVTTK